VSLSALLLVLLSVLLSAAAQILLKLGMSSPAVQTALAAPFGPPALLAIATSPMVVGGLAAFGLSAVVWLFVLSKIDVSYAYPCVALGIVLTVLAGHFLLGEPISVGRIVGVAVIIAGVVIVAAAR
jgi:multidrug transporter EmrE-like cation transporter